MAFPWVSTRVEKGAFAVRPSNPQGRGESSFSYLLLPSFKPAEMERRAKKKGFGVPHNNALNRKVQTILYNQFPQYFFTRKQFRSGLWVKTHFDSYFCFPQTWIHKRKAPPCHTSRVLERMHLVTWLQASGEAVNLPSLLSIALSKIITNTSMLLVSKCTSSLYKHRIILCCLDAAASFR